MHVAGSLAKILFEPREGQNWDETVHDIYIPDEWVGNDERLSSFEQKMSVFESPKLVL